MNNDIYLIGEVGWEITLDSVLKALEKTDKSKPVNVHIHSPGGSVYDGLAIYNHLKNLDQEVHTHSAGLVASIASIFFLAGKRETRTINKMDRFLIHLPAGFDGGNAKDLEKTAEELRKIEGQLADIYAAETDLTKEEALALMEKDEFLDVDFLKDKGFVSEIIEFKAVANLNNRKKMSEKHEDHKGLLDAFDKMFNKYFGKKEDPTNKMVQDANGVEIEFPDVDEGTDPVVGDMALVDGQNAEGEYVMPSGETFVFSNGELAEIVPAEEDMEALKKKVEDLEAELSTANASIEEKDETIASLNTTIENVKKDFKEFKATLSSEFEYKNKKKKEEPAKEKKGRKLFKTEE